MTKTAPAILLFFPLACWAAAPIDIKPGLWQMTTTIQMNGAPPIPNLDQMPPEQRARIEAMMKNMSGRAHVTKSCVTKESIEKAIADAGSGGRNSCNPKLVSASSSELLLHIECSPEKTDTKTTGDVTIQRVDSEHIKGNGTVKSTGASGRAMDMKWTMTGEFLSSDCGNVKPAGE